VAALELRGRQRLERLGALVAMGVLGASPWLAGALDSGVQELGRELLGSAIAGASPAGLPAAAGLHLQNLLLLGGTVIFGLRPPWEVRWLAWPLLPLAVVVWTAVLADIPRRLRRGEPRRA